MTFHYQQYLRNDNLPHIWCPGCSHGIVTKGILRAVDSLGWQKDDMCFVSGIGCASRLPGYIDANTLHTTHGRALAFATGVKMVKSNMHVVIVSGDGDSLAIGGNHFLHSCRRNIDMTLIIFNNNIYGMTGGQTSPTTPFGATTTTQPYGNIENSIDAVNLAIAAGATFVARTTAYHVTQMDKIFAQALAHKGFSVVDVMCDCWTAYGRRNSFKSQVDMLERYKDNTVRLEKWNKMSEEERAGKTPIGVFLDIQRPEYCEEQHKVIERAMSAPSEH